MPYDVDNKKEEGMSRRSRALGHQKGKITTTGFGEPDSREGFDGDLTLSQTASGLVLYIKKDNRWYDVNSFVSKSIAVIASFADVNATPSVKNGTIFNSGAATETITNLQGGKIGQTVTIISKAAITYDVTGTNLKGGSANIVTASGDATTWIYDGSSWYLISWMDVSADLRGTGNGF